MLDVIAKERLTLMLWKRPNPTRCIASVSVWQGPWRRPSLADLHWQRDCSLEGTCIIPRERYVSSLCPQISENWKRIWRILFTLDPKYSYWVRIYLLPLTAPRICSYQDSFVHTGSYFIHTGSEIFIPGSNLFVVFNCPKDLFLPGLVYSYRIPFYSYQIQIY